MSRTTFIDSLNRAESITSATGTLLTAIPQTFTLGPAGGTLFGAAGAGLSAVGGALALPAIAITGLDLQQGIRRGRRARRQYRAARGALWRAQSRVAELAASGANPVAAARVAIREASRSGALPDYLGQQRTASGIVIPKSTRDVIGNATDPFRTGVDVYGRRASPDEILASGRGLTPSEVVARGRSILQRETQDRYARVAASAASTPLPLETVRRSA